MEKLLKDNPKNIQFYTLKYCSSVIGARVRYYEVFVVNKEKIFKKDDILDENYDLITIPFITIRNDNGKFLSSYSIRDYSKSVILSSHPQKAMINEIYSIINLLVKIKYTEN